DGLCESDLSSRYPRPQGSCRTRQQNKPLIFQSLATPTHLGGGGVLRTVPQSGTTQSRFSHSSFHLMLQPRLGCWSWLTGSPAITAFSAARRSRPVTGISFPGR